MQVVAEGIETPEISDPLQDRDDYGQGYLFGKPMDLGGDPRNLIVVDELSRVAALAMQTRFSEQERHTMTTTTQVPRDHFAHCIQVFGGATAASRAPRHR
jgi:hypothetical protein